MSAESAEQNRQQPDNRFETHKPLLDEPRNLFSAAFSTAKNLSQAKYRNAGSAKLLVQMRRECGFSIPD